MLNESAATQSTTFARICSLALIVSASSICGILAGGWRGSGLQFRRMFRLCGVLAQSKKVDSGLQSATGWMESAKGVKLFG